MEIVAPAGDSKSLKAAIAAGADAVYLGIKGFGARRNAVNFYPDELIEYIDYAHERGVRLYLTLNTVMKDSEIEGIYENLKRLYEAGIDAVIVQDFGMFAFIKANFPDLEVHASTQMTVTNHIEAEYLYKEGFKRVVPARELTFDEIKLIRGNSDIELEVFVSGAICICYSGKCTMSSLIGGKSGNRGMCAQPCRKNYSSESGTGFLLSPKDQMMGKDEVEHLMRAGVHSIKIEGRMKNENYVFDMVRHYRKIIDKLEVIGNGEKIFNRGYGKGYFYGAKELINEKYSSHFGYKCAISLGRGFYKLVANIVLGDGIAFVDENKKIVSGEYINKIVMKDGSRVKEAKAGDIVVFDKKTTVEIYKTFDKSINDIVEHDIQMSSKQIPIKGKLTSMVGRNLRFEVQYNKITVEIEKGIIESAEKRVLEKDEIIGALSETGNTSFYFENIEIDTDGKGFLSFKMLKEIRRETLEILAEKIVKSYKRKKEGEAVLLDRKKIKRETFGYAALVKNSKQEEAARREGIEKIYYENYPIIREGKLGEIKSKSVLTHNLYEYITEESPVIDSNMNILNSYALEYFENKGKSKTIYLSNEISKRELESLKTGNIDIGMVIYGRQRVMYLEYGAIIKKAREIFTNENGDRFQVYKNELGNTEIYFEKPLSIINRINELKQFGINELRFDFTNETPEEIGRIIREAKFGGEMIIEYEPFNYERGVF